MEFFPGDIAKINPWGESFIVSSTYDDGDCDLYGFESGKRITVNEDLLIRRQPSNWHTIDWGI